MKISYRFFILILLAILLASCVVKAQSADDDEEEDFQTAPATTAKTTSYQEPAPVVPPKKKSLQLEILRGDFTRLKNLTLKDFTHEFLVIGLFSVYFVFFYMGSSRNEKIANEWAKINTDIWTKNFTQVGKNNKMDMIKDSPRDFMFYATGRAHVQYVYGFFKFASRHDMLTNTIGVLTSSPDSYDRVSFNVTLNDKECDNFVMYICPKLKVKEFTENHWDVKTFAKLRDIPGFPNKHYAVLTDAPEFANSLAKEPRIMNALWASVGLNEKGEGTIIAKPMIESIELSDMPKTKPTSTDDVRYPTRRFIINCMLPRMDKLTDQDREKTIQISQLVMDLIDAAGQFGKLTSEGVSKVKKLRLSAIDDLVKEEESNVKEDVLKKKQEAKKKREEELSKLSPDARRVIEEKDRKKEERRVRAKNAKKGRVTF